MAIKLVFFATPDIALSCFERLHQDKEIEILAFVTQPSRPSGRGNKILPSKLEVFASENNIEIIKSEKISKDIENVEKLKTLGADFFVTFAFGQIISQEIIDIPKFGTINVHASLLPKYRGANPIRQALLDGEEKTGVTTMMTCLEMDEGDICLQEEIPLTADTNSIELTNKISDCAYGLLKKTLEGLYNKSISPTKQDGTKATYTKKTKKEDKIINWEDDAEYIKNKVRALIDNFTCQTTYKGKIVKLIKCSTCPNCGEKGEILNVDKEGILVGCGKNSVLIETVKPEGKGEMAAYAWSLGARIQKGEKFE